MHPKSGTFFEDESALSWNYSCSCFIIIEILFWFRLLISPLLLMKKLSVLWGGINYDSLPFFQEKTIAPIEAIGAFQKLPMVMPSFDILYSSLRKAKRIPPTKGNWFSRLYLFYTPLRWNWIRTLIMEWIMLFSWNVS